MSIRIVPAQEKHIAGFYKALDIVAKEEIYILLLEAPPFPSTEQFVKGNIAKGVPQCFALDGEEVVGWADVSPLSRLTIEHRGMLGMGIIPEYRGKGIGSMLLKEVISLCRAKGLEKIELDVYAENSAAIALYKKFGFEDEGVRKKARKLHEKYSDIRMMGLIL